MVFIIFSGPNTTTAKRAQNYVNLLFLIVLTRYWSGFHLLNPGHTTSFGMNRPFNQRTSPAEAFLGVGNPEIAGNAEFGRILGPHLVLEGGPGGQFAWAELRGIVAGIGGFLRGLDGAVWFGCQFFGLVAHATRQDHGRHARQAENPRALHEFAAVHLIIFGHDDSFRWLDFAIIEQTLLRFHYIIDTRTGQRCPIFAP